MTMSKTKKKLENVNELQFIRRLAKDENQKHKEMAIKRNIMSSSDSV